ncbi:MAG TPA: hypothetical protein VK629_18115, partial [Steroidobacteraceae bacterium]|nr:hypothetical protein [Steroidobacteraceae bacterium]
MPRKVMASRKIFVSVSAAGLLAMPALDAVAQEPTQTCYQDDSGRIVTRRRPGYREVPCPSTQTERPATNEAPVPDRTAPTETRPQPRPLPGRTPRDVPLPEAPPPPRRPASVSPIPRPGLGDYPQSVPLPDRWRIVD